MIKMETQNKAWQCLIDVAFNDKKDVPIEYIAEFRKLAALHNLEDYCDYLRDKPLPEKLKEDPWEWKYLEELEKVLPQGVQILVLKGGAARDMNLYPLPSLRKSCDLDIFFSRFETYNEQKEFVEYLGKKNIIELTETNWQKRLKELGTLVVKSDGNDIDVHFNLFFQVGNLSNIFPKTTKYQRELESGITQRAVPYRRLKNIKKMLPEDFWLYSVFHFLKHFPIINLASILDPYLLLKKDKISLDKLKVHAIETNQLFIYNIGVYLLSQINPSHFQDYKLDLLHKKIFKLKRIIEPANYGIKHNFLSYYSKEAVFTTGNILLSVVTGLTQLLITRLILGSFGENIFSKTGISNLITKILYTNTRIKNYLKYLCLKTAGINNKVPDINIEVIKTDKELISIKLNALQLTFEIPLEFSPDLKKVWSGFLTEEHLSEKIVVEKISTQNDDSLVPNLTFSEDSIFVKLQNYSYGKAKSNSSGSFFARGFWDVRTFTLCLFRAMTFEKEDLLLVHAGGGKLKDKTLIFPGGSSAGKTTFFNLLAKNGVGGINDDTILLKKENNTWYAYPTPFMSRNQEAVTCEKSRLDGLINLVKVTGGHELKPIDLAYNLANLLNNSISDFIIDDSGFIKAKLAHKISNLAKQIIYSAEIKFSLNDNDKLLGLINKWLDNPNYNFKHGHTLHRLIEYRGKSMRTTFNDGDILIVKEVSPENLNKNDIICFTTDKNNCPLTHRVRFLIRHKERTTIITKGDKNIYYDLPSIFTSNQKLLKVVKKL